MSYYESLRLVTQAESTYYSRCAEYGEDDGLSIEALIEYHELKKEHRALFGSLTRVNGQWV